MVASKEADTVMAPVKVRTMAEATHAAPCPDTTFVSASNALSFLKMSAPAKHSVLGMQHSVSPIATNVRKDGQLVEEVERAASLQIAIGVAANMEASAVPTDLHPKVEALSSAPQEDVDAALEVDAPDLVYVDASKMHLLRRVEPRCYSWETASLELHDLAHRADPDAEDFFCLARDPTASVTSAGELPSASAQTVSDDENPDVLDSTAAGTGPEATDEVNGAASGTSAEATSAVLDATSGIPYGAAAEVVRPTPVTDSASSASPAIAPCDEAMVVETRAMTASDLASAMEPAFLEDAWSCADDVQIPCEGGRSSQPSEAQPSQHAWAEILGQIAYAPDALIQSLAREVAQELDLQDAFCDSKRSCDDVTSAEGADESLAATVPMLQKRALSSDPAGVSFADFAPPIRPCSGVPSDPIPYKPVPLDLQRSNSRAEIPVEGRCNNLKISPCTRLTSGVERLDMAKAIPVDISLERACSWDEITLFDDDIDDREAQLQPPLQERGYSFSCRGISCRAVNAGEVVESHSYFGQTEEFLEGASVCQEWQRSVSRPFSEEEAQCGTFVVIAAEDEPLHTQPVVTDVWL